MARRVGSNQSQFTDPMTSTMIGTIGVVVATGSLIYSVSQQERLKRWNESENKRRDEEMELLKAEIRDMRLGMDSLHATQRSFMSELSQRAEPAMEDDIELEDIEF